MAWSLRGALDSSRTRRRGAASTAPPAGIAPTAACYAPFSSLYLDPQGNVLACCMNHWQRLGTIRERSLVEIWQGDGVRQLRESLRVADFSRGCELCARHVVDDGSVAAYLHVYDDLRPEVEDPPWPVALELALSNACNLQCVMCNGDLSSSIRIHREGRPALPTVYDEAFFEELDLFLPHLRRVTFLGGEPFLAAESLRVMRRLVELGLRPACHVTTNGTQLGERVETIIRSLPMHVAVSVDGVSAEVVERIRVGVDAAVLRRNVLRLHELVHDVGNTMSFSFALMVPNWTEFRGVLEWADELGIDVFVNDVDFPMRFSLRRLPTDELAEVVEFLHRQRDQAAPLGRNCEVFEREVESLERHLSQRRAPTRSLGRRDGRDGGTRLMVGRDQLVLAVEGNPAPVGGLDLSVLVGRPLADLQPEFIAALGPVVSSDLVVAPDGEQRTVVFERDGQTTEVRLDATVSGSGEEEWVISVPIEEPVTLRRPEAPPARMPRSDRDLHRPVRPPT